MSSRSMTMSLRLSRRLPHRRLLHRPRQPVPSQREVAVGNNQDNLVHHPPRHLAWMHTLHLLQSDSVNNSNSNNNNNNNNNDSAVNSNNSGTSNNRRLCDDDSKTLAQSTKKTLARPAVGVVAVAVVVVASSSNDSTRSTVSLPMSPVFSLCMSPTRTEMNLIVSKRTSRTFGLNRVMPRHLSVRLD